VECDREESWPAIGRIKSRGLSKATSDSTTSGTAKTTCCWNGRTDPYVSEQLGSERRFTLLTHAQPIERGEDPR